MTLSVFTANDRRRLQHYLDLPIQAVSEGSSLYRSLVFVEQLDKDEGTQIASSVQARLDSLEALESIDTSSGTFINAAQTEASQVRSVSITDQYSKTFGGSSAQGGLSGTAAALEQQKKRLIEAIKRDIGFSRQTNNNGLNAVWPGGLTDRRNIGVNYGDWRPY